MLIKICGLTNAHTARQAVLAGADYIGLLFSPQSVRQISINIALDITKAVREAGADVVGVFVDESLTEVEQIATALQLKIIQLHGQKVRNYCNVLGQNHQLIYVWDKAQITLPSSLDPCKDFILFDNKDSDYSDIGIIIDKNFRYFVAGNLSCDNVVQVIKTTNPYAVDVSSAVESSVAVKDINKICQFIHKVRPERYGRFGGRFVPELLIQPLRQIEIAFDTIVKTLEFKQQFLEILKNYAGRPTSLTKVGNFAKAIGDFSIFLKREDLLHTGAHKINNAIGQCMMAKKMGKTRIIAETGAGQHGVATATACAMFSLSCTIYMGSVDIKRQAPNVAKMRLLGAKVIAVDSGSATLKDAVNEALRDWGESYDTSHYCLGSALGPYPFPQLVAYFHKVIGEEAREQFLAATNGVYPDMVIACVGGGSNAIGIFQGFIDYKETKLIGVEAGGRGTGLGNNAARFSEGSLGVLHGAYTYILQEPNGQVAETHSISAGLDYPAVGPEHAYLYLSGRAQYDRVTDDEALAAFLLLIKTEGIVPALESAHALAYVIKHASSIKADSKVLINLSGRGDKDLPQLLAGALKNDVTLS